MPTNLAAVNDHPSTVLIAAAPKPDHEVVTNIQHFVADSARAVWFERAAHVLREYEAQHDVTFAALDNDALANLRDAWDACADSSDVPAFLKQVKVVFEAISDLLGLGE